MTSKPTLQHEIEGRRLQMVGYSVKDQTLINHKSSISTTVISIYIGYWCFGNICNKKEVYIDFVSLRLPKILELFGIICQHLNHEIHRGIFFLSDFQYKTVSSSIPLLDNTISFLQTVADFKNIACLQISGRFIKYIPVTRQRPQLIASNCFLSKNWDSKVGY